MQCHALCVCGCCVCDSHKHGIVWPIQSSVVAALLRLYPLQGGRVEVDGVDTRAVSLHDLRAGFTVILQDPFLFRGTIRENLLGPGCEGSVSDEAVVAALGRVGLLHRLEERCDGVGGVLDMGVERDGSNLSAGERQLVCLARALLRGGK